MEPGIWGGEKQAVARQATHRVAYRTSARPTSHVLRHHCPTLWGPHAGMRRPRSTHIFRGEAPCDAHKHKLLRVERVCRGGRAEEGKASQLQGILHRVRPIKVCVGATGGSACSICRGGGEEGDSGKLKGILHRIKVGLGMAGGAACSGSDSGPGGGGR